MSGDKLLTVDEVAELLALATGTIYHLVSQKRLPVVRLSSRCLRFRRSDMDSWIAGKVENPGRVDFKSKGRKQ